jgi:hypothetical protein
MTTAADQLHTATESTRELARQLTGIPPGWAFWCLHLTARMVPPAADRRHPFSGWHRGEGPPDEHIEWTATAYFGKRPFNSKGRRALTVTVPGNRPLRALERLRQVLRNPRRHANRQQRSINLSSPHSWPDPFRFDS